MNEKKYKRVKNFLSDVLIIMLMVSLVGCNRIPPNQTLSSSNKQNVIENILSENLEVETTEVETAYPEFITEEIYITEIVEVEKTITELLLEEKTISEVVSCKTIYVPQDHIEDFSQHSQIAELFSGDMDLGPVLTKVAIGTGVIVTLVVLKRVGLPDPIASCVVAAANESLKFAAGGAVVGSLFGGLTGATDEIDASGRASAVTGFALAVVGLIVTSVSLVAAIPSAGTTTITAAAGIKLIMAGMFVAGAAAGTVMSGEKAVSVFTATDGTDIDWNNINWNAVGVPAAEKAISNGADGYMWGSIIGAVHGGANGYDKYQKFNAPCTKYEFRIKYTPKNGKTGKWTGERGESDFILKDPIDLSNGTKIIKVKYKNGVPDFSPYQKAQVKILKMTDQRYKTVEKELGNFDKADEALAKYWTKIKYKGKTWEPREIRGYREGSNLTWHEMSNMESMQLVPKEVNSRFLHTGGVSECKAMTGQNGGADFD